MNVPTTVLKARARYREEEDTLGLFISEYCVIADECTVKPQLLYSKYVEWTETNNIRAMSGTSFGLEISKTYRKVHTMNGNCYTGIGLQSEYPEETERQEKERYERITEHARSNGHHKETVSQVKLVTGIID